MHKHKVKQVIPQSLSPPGTVPWQQQTSTHSNGPPSPTSMSSGCSSPGYSPSRGLDLSGSSSSFSERKAAAYNYKGGPVHEWTKEQVNKLNIFCTVFVITSIVTFLPFKNK